MVDSAVLSSFPLLALVFLVAAIYSSVGHGGASGYLAILALFSLPVAQLSGTALVLNVLVSSLAFWSFWRNGHKLPNFSWLLVLASVPFSFMGGAVVSANVFYNLLLAVALFAIALRLIIDLRPAESYELVRPHPVVLAGTGSGIGLISGIVGVGGGIFLSPIALLLRWTTVKSAGTLSALFILVNSLSGIAGRAITGNLTVSPAIGLIAAAFAGGLLGSHLGSKHFGGVMLRRMLALVLLVAAAKLAYTAF